MNTKHKLLSYFFNGIFILPLIGGLHGATVWNGDVDEQFLDPGNWTNGIPTITSGATVEGDYNVLYNTSSDLNNITVTFKSDGIDSPTISGLALSLNQTTLNIEGDTNFTVTGDFIAGATASGGGATIGLHGNSLLTITDRLFIGNNAVSSMVQSGTSTLNIQGDRFDIGRNTGASGSSYILQGGTINAAERARVVNSSSFDLQNGTFNVGEHFVVRNASSFTMSGGNLNILNNLNLATTGGTGIISDGTVNVGGTINVVGPTSQLDISGGNVTANVIQANSGSLLNATGGSIVSTGQIRVQNGSTFNQSTDISVGTNLLLRNGDGGIWNATDGELTVNGNIQLQGTASIFNQNGADVDVMGQLSINSTGSYTLNNGRLEVAGSINADTGSTFDWSNGGIVSVHSAATIIDYNGDLTASTGAILDLEASTEFLDVNGILTVNDLTIDGYSLGLMNTLTLNQDCYTLITAGTLIGEANISYTNFTDLAGATRIDLGDPYDVTNRRCLLV